MDEYLDNKFGIEGFFKNLKMGEMCVSKEPITSILKVTLISYYVMDDFGISVDDEFVLKLILSLN